MINLLLLLLDEDELGRQPLRDARLLLVQLLLGADVLLEARHILQQLLHALALGAQRGLGGLQRLVATRPAEARKRETETKRANE